MEYNGRVTQCAPTMAVRLPTPEMISAQLFPPMGVRVSSHGQGNGFGPGHRGTRFSLAHPRLSLPFFRVPKAREAAAAKVQKLTGAVFIPPYNDARIIAGQVRSRTGTSHERFASLKLHGSPLQSAT